MAADAVARGGNWTAIAAQLDATMPGPDTDDYIDALTDRALRGEPDPAAAPMLARALERAESTLSRRSAALALAVCAAPTDGNALDGLDGSYRRARQDGYLGPALLDALGLYALRSPVGRTATATAILRIRPDDTQHLRVRAARIIGKLDNIHPQPELRDKLREFAASDDLAVQAEARQQLALIALGDALLAADASDLWGKLRDARAMFARAEASEEHRPDASLFVLLLDALLAFGDLPRDREGVAKRLDELVGALGYLLMDLGAHAWHGYRSPIADMVGTRVFGIADALQRGADATSHAEEWTNFDQALVDLAALHVLIRSPLSSMGGYARLDAAMRAVADAVVLPPLGPILARAVGARRLAAVIDRYTAAHGYDAVATALRALAGAAEAAGAPSGLISPEVAAHVSDIEARTGRTADALLLDLRQAIEEGDVEGWVRRLGLATAALPIDRPGLYGSDPAVDETVRPILESLRARLGPCPGRLWLRLVQALEEVVSFVHYVRDVLPPYTLCTEDGGLGQGASEDDLQKDLFRWLRQRFGRDAVYESTRVGGGRPDTGLAFFEGMLPIEVKAEYRSVAPVDVRDHYLTQADDYATARQRVSFLVILDLRHANAAGHRERVRQRRKDEQPDTRASLYRLCEGVWVDALPPDLQVPHAQSNAVIVFLVPGNRARASSTTEYSNRPAKARRKRR